MVTAGVVEHDFGSRLHPLYMSFFCYFDHHWLPGQVPGGSVKRFQFPTSI